MKESISYSFLLNIVILFIFVCAAIVMGIFSYYRAFKANTIIINAIEKYEGYNCLSAQEAAQKLASISYNVPFDVKCKSNYGEPCMVDSLNNYAVVSYNIDYNNGQYKDHNSIHDVNKFYSNMNSQYFCNGINNCESTKKYQYGVYTYMYIDLPVVSSLIRIPYFSKTGQLYEFRNLSNTMIKIDDVNRAVTYDLNFIPYEFIEEYYEDSEYDFYNTLFNKNVIDGAEGAYNKIFILGLDDYAEELYGSNARKKYQVSNSPQYVRNGYSFECGFTINYSSY